MEELQTQRLKGYAQVKIVGMQYQYKNSDGQRLPNPMPGCPVSLQLEPSNPYDCNAIKVINEVNNCHLGYIDRETASALNLILDDNTFASARGILSMPRDHYCCLEVISCQVLLFFALPPGHIPPLPPQLDFHEDLSSSHFMLVNTPAAFTDSTLDDYDAYVTHLMAPLRLQPQVKQPLLHPCSTKADSPVHVNGDDATAPLDLPLKFQTQSQTETQDGTQSEVQGTAQRNEVACMKCKQRGGAPFFQCAQSGCPLLIHANCIGDVIGDYCHFCLYLGCRKEYYQSRKDSSSCKAACKEEYKKARNVAIRFLGGSTFIRLRELTDLHPLHPQQVQLLQNTEMPTDEIAESQNSVGVANQIKKGTELSPLSEAQTQVLAAERNEFDSMICKQIGGAPFFECAQSECPLFISESCILGFVGCTCLFCLVLACRGERLRAKKGSDLYVALTANYDEARKSAIRLFGKGYFMRLRKLAGLDPILPSTVQVPCIVNKQCYPEEGREEEAVGVSATIEKSAAKEKKEKGKDAANGGREENLEEKEVVGRGKRRLPPRPSLDRACKKRKQA